MLFFLAGLAIALTTAAFTAIFGLVALDGGRMTLYRDPGQSMAESRMTAIMAPAFVPLELTDAGMKWPSEVPRPSNRLPEPPWPSETWGDDFFGRKGTRPAGPATSPAAQHAARHAADEDDAAPTPPPAPRQQPAKAAPKAAPPAKAANPPAKRPPARAGAGISDADLVRLVESQGLAKAVDVVRGKTGWDFQQAAKHIAEVLRAKRQSEGRA